MRGLLPSFIRFATWNRILSAWKLQEKIAGVEIRLKNVEIQVNNMGIEMHQIHIKLELHGQLEKMREAMMKSEEKIEKRQTETNKTLAQLLEKLS